MGASDARGRDVGEAVIAALHPFAPLGTSGGFDRGAGRLDISSRTLRGSPDLLCKLRSSTRIECEDRVNVSRVKKSGSQVPGCGVGSSALCSSVKALAG
jgi:hypothetical protein